MAVNLSPGMVSAAGKKAAQYQLQLQDRVSFQQGDVLRLDDIEDDRFDLASFTGAAHHLPRISDVARVLRQMDRLGKPEDLVMLMDLVRLRTASITDALCQHYRSRLRRARSAECLRRFPQLHARGLCRHELS